MALRCASFPSLSGMSCVLGYILNSFTIMHNQWLHRIKAWRAFSATAGISHNVTYSCIVWHASCAWQRSVPCFICSHWLCNVHCCKQNCWVWAYKLAYKPISPITTTASTAQKIVIEIGMEQTRLFRCNRFHYADICQIRDWNRDWIFQNQQCSFWKILNEQCSFWKILRLKSAKNQ